jgi:hypothetical protein
MSLIPVWNDSAQWLYGWILTAQIISREEIKGALRKLPDMFLYCRGDVILDMHFYCPTFDTAF